MSPKTPDLTPNAPTETPSPLDETPFESALNALKKDGEQARRAGRYLVELAKQLILATAIGLTAGVVGTAFQAAMRFSSGFFADNYRAGFPWALFLLPVIGPIIVFLYDLARLPIDAGTNQVVESLTSRKKASLWLAPLIFLGSVLTQFGGGSGGREGAALQLGGCVGLGAGRFLRLRGPALHIAILCGMSGGFAAVFGTPLTAAVFALEIACVGVVYYPAFLASLISALVGASVSSAFGFPAFHFDLPPFPQTSILLIAKTIVLGVLCGTVCVFFCASIRACGASFTRRFPNDYYRAAFGGLLVVAATLLLGTNVFNGTGLTNVEAAFAGKSGSFDFFWKTIFTAITIGAGFKGGEIVPALAVGATFGAFAAGWLGLAPELGAAMGMVAVFCGAVNCPLTAIILSVEIFGAENVLLFAILCGVGYMTSGHSGLYRSQRIRYSKLTADEIDAPVR